jgi:pyruvate dehydrogenase E1 component alpha subunit
VSPNTSSNTASAAQTESAAAPAADVDRLRHLYTQMLRIRRFEEAAARAYTQGKISGFLHLYIGQEAIAVATADLMEPGDRVVTTYRDHGFAIALGCDSGACMAELYGKATGLVGGVGGSMHFFSKQHGLWGGYAIVGSHVPVAAGHAFASKYTNDGKVTLCFLGEGAMHIGATAEGMNLAGLWRLPIVFVIENNMYAMGTPLRRQSPVDDLTTRAPGWALDHDRWVVDDVLTTRDRLAAAVERARREQRPALIELLTYRFRGHSMSDPGKYRTKDEVDEWKQRDPMHRCEQQLAAAGVAEDALAKIDDAVVAEMDAALQFADTSPLPEPEHRFRHNLVEDV